MIKTILTCREDLYSLQKSVDTSLESYFYNYFNKITKSSNVKLLDFNLFDVYYNLFGSDWMYELVLVFKNRKSDFSSLLAIILETDKWMENNALFYHLK